MTYEPTEHRYEPVGDTGRCKCGAYGFDPVHGRPCDRYQPTPTQYCGTCGLHRIDHAYAAGGIGNAEVGPFVGDDAETIRFRDHEDRLIAADVPGDR